MSLSIHYIHIFYTDDSVALRLYLGMEYECPRGHRFFCSSPDKMFKVPSSGIFKVVFCGETLGHTFFHLSDCVTPTERIQIDDLELGKLSKIKFSVVRVHP